MTKHAERTHPGRRAGDNEDATGSNANRQWYFVADGMGGQGNGRVASNIVKDTMQATETPDDLLFAIHQSHLQILSATQQDPALKNMGSTIVAVELKRSLGHVAWVGDSRAYLYRNMQLSRLTRDHSFVEVLRVIQGLTEEQVRGHPEGNVITRGLGMEESAASMIDLPMRTGDRIILCSDGLTDELADPDIAKVLETATDADDAADKLISHALANGGRDNVSVVVVDYDGPTNRLYWLKNLKPSVIWPIVAGVVAATIVTSLALWYLTKHHH